MATEAETTAANVLAGIARAHSRINPNGWEERDNENGSVTIPNGKGVVDVFVQHHEEGVEHSPDEARELAYDLLASAEIAEFEAAGGSVDDDREDER